MTFLKSTQNSKFKQILTCSFRRTRFHTHLGVSDFFHRRLFHRGAAYQISLIFKNTQYWAPRAPRGPRAPKNSRNIFDLMLSSVDQDRVCQKTLYYNTIICYCNIDYNTIVYFFIKMLLLYV
uniref:Uncharacterized protein n=1 Tax=Cacopsylla melanoneura TaxID=428564 RepID=A0A8D8VKA1_9HEMI